MKQINAASEYELSTGRTFYAHLWLLSPDPYTEELYGGFDHRVNEAHVGPSLNPLTRAERREIAAFITEVWSQWAER